MAEVRVRLRGQLGNQLFCYYAGAYLAEKLDAELILDCNYFQGSDGRLSLLDFQLPFRFRLAGATPRRNRFLGVNRTQKLFLLGRKLFAHSGNDVHVSPVDFGFFDFSQLMLNSETDTVELNGFFQTYRYFNALFAEDGGTATELVLREPPKWLEEIRANVMKDDTLAIHVRLGDYLGSPRALDYPRFISALWHDMALGERYSRALVFSDDFAMASSLLRGALPVSVEAAPCPPDARPSEVMVALSRATSLVISNSSFSWWSAFSSNASEIYAPWPWISPRYQSGAWMRSDLIPSGWHIARAMFEESSD
jgi:hypothetical protein